MNLNSMAWSDPTSFPSLIILPFFGMIILTILVSLMMTSCVVHRVPKPTTKHDIEFEGGTPNPDTEKQKVTYRITIIIKEIVVENVEDVEGMLPKKDEQKKGGELLWVK